MSTTTSSVTSHFPKPQDGFTTTTSGSISSGATSVGLNSTGSYTNGDIFVGIIDPTDANKKQAFTGTVDTSGVQITGVVWTSGTNQNHSAGATVVDYVTATHLGMVSKGILVAHNQDGTPKSGITYPASTYTTPTIADFTNATHSHSNATGGGALNGANAITDGTITPAELTSGTGSSWAWQSWTPTFANLTAGSGTHASKYIQIGKTVFYRMQFTLAGDSTVGTNPTFTLPVTSVSYSQANQGIGQFDAYDSSPAGTANGFIGWLTTTTAQLFVYTTSGSTIVPSGLASTVPFTWATGDKVLAQGFYEAA